MPLNLIQPYNVNTTAQFVFANVVSTALVANTTSTNSISANTITTPSLVANSTTISLNTGVLANGSLGTTTQILSTTGSNVYWADKTPLTNSLIIALIYR